jgi:AcrR family transcriptional regulator
MSATNLNESSRAQRPRGEAGRARLLDAALQSFAAHGFHGTSTRTIAEKAGLSPAAVYVHHQSKEDLLFTISRAGHEQALDVIAAAIARSDDPESQLYDLAEAFTAWHAHNHTLARVVQYEIGALSEDHHHQIADIRRRTQRLVREVVVAGVERGRFHVDAVDITVLALVSLGIDVARWYRDDGSWTPALVGKHYAKLAMRLVGSSLGS